MDLFSHRVYIESQRTKEDRQVASSFMRCWKTIGIPDFLQIDNELSSTAATNIQGHLELF